MGVDPSSLQVLVHRGLHVEVLLRLIFFLLAVRSPVEANALVLCIRVMLGAVVAVRNVCSGVVRVGACRAWEVAGSVRDCLLLVAVRLGVVRVSCFVSLHVALRIMCVALGSARVARRVVRVGLVVEACGHLVHVTIGVELVALFLAVLGVINGHLRMLVVGNGSLMVLVVEKRLNLDISFCHLVESVRRVRDLFARLMVLNVIVLLVIMVYIMHVVLLLVVAVAGVLMEGRSLLLVVQTVLFSVGGLEATLVLRQMHRLSLLLMLVLVLFVGVGGLPGRVLLVDLALVNILGVILGGQAAV
jgi:hypothetical protein|mmetsp:Transcript_41383/g.54430  ORF Transcript_41383/g.54430 Transcript_41383/m.54430 type:complete len:302 (-) Transcript_41383:3197-4102(-)